MPDIIQARSASEMADHMLGLASSTRVEQVSTEAEIANAQALMGIGYALLAIENALLGIDHELDRANNLAEGI